MIDPYNPTKDEITEWAFEKKSYLIQDWELVLIQDISNIDLIVTLYKDDKCEKKKFFLSCLYVYIGDFVRTKHLKSQSEIIFSEELLRKSLNDSDSEISIWAKRATDLMENPDKYTYEYWGLGSKYVYP